MLLIGRERGKGQIGKIPGPSPSKSGKSQKNRESPKKDKKGQKGTKKEGQVQIGKPPRLKHPRLAALEGGGVFIDTEYDRANVPPYNGNDPPPAPGSLKRSLFPTLLNEVQNKGMQGVRARYGAELPPIISIVRYPGRPVISVPENFSFFFFSVCFLFFPDSGAFGLCTRSASTQA